MDVKALGPENLFHSNKGQRNIIKTRLENKNKNTKTHICQTSYHFRLEIKSHYNPARASFPRGPLTFLYLFKFNLFFKKPSKREDSFDSRFFKFLFSFFWSLTSLFKKEAESKVLLESLSESRHLMPGHCGGIHRGFWNKQFYFSQIQSFPVSLKRMKLCSGLPKGAMNQTVMVLSIQKLISKKWTFSFFPFKC